MADSTERYPVERLLRCARTDSLNRCMEADTIKTLIQSGFDDASDLEHIGGPHCTCTLGHSER